MGVLHVPSATLDDLIATAKADPADDTAAMAEILRRFEGAVLKVARAVTTDWHLQQDAAQGARLGLVQAVRAHTPGTKGFASYARCFMKGTALRVVSSMTSSDVIADPQDSARAESMAEQALADTTLEVVDLIRTLTPGQQIIVDAYYIGDHRLNDIARGLGISTSAVSQRLATIHRALRPVVEEALAA